MPSPTHTLTSYAKHALILVALFLSITLVIDYLRSPTPATTAQLSASQQRTTQGNTIPLIHSSKPTLIYFWGTWCAVCKRTSPSINSFHRDDAFHVVSIAMQSGTDAKLNAYLSQKSLSFHTINDAHSALANQWGVQVVPSIVVIRNGRIRQSFTGFNSYPVMRAKIWLYDLF